MAQDGDGGFLFNQAWHAFDMLVWWMGRVAEAQGMLARRHHSVETEDVALPSFRFENGAFGYLKASNNVYASSLEESISILGEKGTIVIGGGRIDPLMRVWRVQSDDELGALREQGERFAPRHCRSWAHEMVLWQFLAHVQAGGCTVLLEVLDALRIVAVAERGVAWTR